MKNCDRGLENAAFALRSRGAFSSLRSRFFTLRTDPEPFLSAVNWLTSGFANATLSFNRFTRRLQNRFISNYFLLGAFSSPATTIFELPWRQTFFRVVPRFKHSSLFRQTVTFFKWTNWSLERKHVKFLELRLNGSARETQVLKTLGRFLQLKRLFLFISGSCTLLTKKLNAMFPKTCVSRAELFRQSCQNLTCSRSKR